MLLTNAQILEIRAIIQRHHSAFIVNALSPNAVDPAILAELRQRGLIDIKVSGVEDSYLYGQVLAQATDPAVAAMSYPEFRNHIRKNPVPLNDIEKRAVSMAELSAAEYCHGLGNRISQQTGDLLIEADAELRRELQTTIKTKTAENIARRQSVKQLKSDLGWATKDWARDWDRIAVTEKNNAMQAGTRDHYRDRFGADVKVARVPAPDACENCKRLYLGSDGQPFIFKLSDLEKNGHTNYGRKAADWLPVTGSTHPHCACQTIRVPDGWGFDEDGSLVPGGEFGTEAGSAAELRRSRLQRDDLIKALKSGNSSITFQGLDIAIETKAGEERHWETAEGERGTTKMIYAYGFIKRSTGADQDEIDVFVGPDKQAKMAFIIHQKNPDSGIYDEDKVMLGCGSEAHAKAIYHQHYDRPGFYAGCSQMDIEHLKRWAAGSEVTPGNMLVKGRRMGVDPGNGDRTVFVVVDALQKARIPAAIGAANSTAGDRAPGPGLGVNYVIRPPREPGSSISLEARALLDAVQAQAAEPIPDSLKRDKEIYEVSESQRNVHPLVIPEPVAGREPSAETIDSTKHIVESRIKDNTGTPVKLTELEIEPGKNVRSKRKRRKKKKGKRDEKESDTRPGQGATD